MYKIFVLTLCVGIVMILVSISSLDGRPRPTVGCPSVRKLLDVYGELETPSTLCTPTSSSFVSPCGVLHSALRLRLSASASTRLGDNSEQSSSLPDSLTLNDGEHKFTESLICCMNQEKRGYRVQLAGAFVTGIGLSGIVFTLFGAGPAILR